jgi:hypothetical protein
MRQIPRRGGQDTRFGHVPRALGLASVGQMGYLVADVEAACRRHALELEITTWYRPRIRGQKLVANGRALDQRFEIAIGYACGLQIEILSLAGPDRGQLSRAPPTNDLELHHIGIFVDDVRGSEARLRALGHATLQSGWFSFAPGTKTRVAYLDTMAAHGIVVELIENRVGGWLVNMPEWYVRLGVAAGYVRRLA